MKKLLILAVAMLLLSFTQTETKKNYYSNGKLKDQVEIDNGMFNGKYTAWYYNGKKKAEGTFKNNQRIGKWTVYDSLGKVRMIREYENSFTFKTITAKNSKGIAIVLPEKVTYELKRSKEGFYEYPEINEKDISFSKQIWRIIELNPANNVLFEENIFADLLLKNVFDTKKLTPYVKHDFMQKYNVDTLKKEFDKKKLNVIGFKLNEIWFYNAAWQMSEERIIGICPMAMDENDGTITEFFWIYFPELRSITAAEKVAIKDAATISNLDDVFWFSYYSGSISVLKVVEVDGNLPLNKLVKDEEEQTEMELLDTEHDLWISLTEKQ